MTATNVNNSGEAYTENCANTFTVEGRGLPADMTFKLDECANVQAVAENSSETSRQFNCGAALAASGDLSGSLALATGKVFHTFSACTLFGCGRYNVQF